MKSIARSLVIMLVALIAVPALVVSVTITAAVQLLATTALIMGGTQHSLGADDDQGYIPGYLNWAANGFIEPASGVAPGTLVAVTYPAQFAPVNGTTTFDDSVDDGVDNLGSCLDGDPTGCDHNPNIGGAAPLPSQTHFAIFGYSQSAVVASLVKNQLIDNQIPTTNLDGTEFYLISNPMRPNGGILARDFEGFTIPLIGITFYGPTENSCPTATPCSPTATTADPNIYPTVDVAQQYDFLGGDAPMRPLNLLAMANSIAAYQQLHGAVQNHTLDEGGLIDQGKYGDTHYYMIAADTLPILQPLVTAGVPAPALALPDAILRVWIEDAYDRNTSPGEHVKFNYIPIGNPISLIGNSLGAIPVGIDDTVAGFTTPGNRPLGTQPAGPFGVGGPPVELTPSPLATTSAPQLKVVQDQQTTTPGDNKLAKDEVDASKLGNDTVSPNSGNPNAIKPSLPFEKWRQTSATDPDRRPFGIRPGEGPISRIVKALTGQKEKETATNDDAATKDAAA
jgi:hypothetical protein